MKKTSPFHFGDILISIVILVVIIKNILNGTLIYGISAWFWIIVFIVYIIVLWTIRRKKQ